MKTKIKPLSLMALAAVMFAGCVSEQERQAIAAAEKERQEQIAAKEREEAQLRRQKTVDEINNSTNQYFVLDVMKNGQDEELRELAKSRLRDITLQMISMSSNITMLALISDSSAHEKLRQEVTAKIAKEKAAHETAVNRFFHKIDAHIDQCITHNGFVSQEWIQWEEWKSIAPDIQNDINAKLHEFSQFVQSAKQTTKGMYLDVWAERRWIKTHDKTWYASVETFKRKAISSLPNSKLANELDLNTAKYEMPEVRTAAQRRIEELRTTLNREEARLHRQKTIDEINDTTDPYFALDMMESEKDEELRKMAESRLRDISVQEISLSTNIVMLNNFVSTNEHEQYCRHITAQVANEKEQCGVAINKVWQYLIYDYKRVCRDWGHGSLHDSREWHKTAEWECLPSDVKEIINAACDDFVKDFNAIQVEYRRMEVRSPDATSVRNARVSNRFNALKSLEKQIKQQTLASVVCNGRWARLLKLYTAKRSMPEVYAAAKGRFEALRKAHIDRQGKLIERYYNHLTDHNYKLFLCVLEDYYRWRHVLAYDNGYNVECRNLVGYRRDITKEDAMAGASELEAFGIKYLPNSYANYEKIRANAEEVQQMFNEEFPEPYKMRSDMPTWNAFEKLLRGLIKARTQSLRRHDELCHFYLLHKIGAVSSADLAKIDSKPICIRLFEVNPGVVDFSKPGVNATQLVSVEPKVYEFANKYAPETYGLYQKFMTERTETQKLFDDLQKDLKMMDIVRFELSVVACREKIDFTSQTMNVIAKNFQAWHMDYKLQEKDAVAIASLDHECALKWKGFAELLSSYLKERANGPLLAAKNPMNKFYRCDIVRPWHCPALGFYYLDNHSYLVYNDVYDAPNLMNRSVASGLRIDMPRLFSDPNEGKKRYGGAYGTTETISIFGALYRNRTGEGPIFCGLYDSNRSAFLRRLNNIDADKAFYVGWEIEGISRHPQGDYGCSVNSFVRSFDKKGFKLAAKLAE